VPSHDLTRFYALIPALAVLAFLMPTVFVAITTAIGARKPSAAWQEGGSAPLRTGRTPMAAGPSQFPSPLWEDPRMSITERQAAEHAGLWKADRGRAPHYGGRAGIEAGGWTCIACPLDDCEWHHDDPITRPTAPEQLDAIVREHLQGHDLVDFLTTIQTARNAVVSVRESNDRAWDVVSLHRLRAIHRGEHPTTDPVAQMLSAALVGTAEHEDVRREVTELSKGVAGAEGIASVPSRYRKHRKARPCHLVRKGSRHEAHSYQLNPPGGSLEWFRCPGHSAV
jgi:hypothetical protein